MPLDSRQMVVVQSPWGATTEELLTLMEILGDYGEWSALGERRFALVMQLEKAAVSRQIEIPAAFAAQLRNIHKLGSITQRI